MVPIIPEQRKNKVKSHFSDLVKYITKDSRELTVLKEIAPKVPQTQFESQGFSDIVNYAVGNNEKNTDAEKCIAIRISGSMSVESAAQEMAAVANKNLRCKDPAYHFILSWPEHENPEPEKIFDAAEHAIKALGLAEHQYVLAVHGNTDNTHCHVSVNRIHPVTFKSRNIEWSKKTLHMAARESEIKHGWSHDNGIYIVKTNGHGKKTIVLNPEYANAVDENGKQSGNWIDKKEELPAWHDPDSLDSWLKSKVAKELKYALPQLDSWPALHAWLDVRGIELKDSGGRGMRLHATSQETGEIIDMPASKGLRLLKRASLEKNWGPFSNSTDIPVQVTDLSHLTPAEINQGVSNVLNRTSFPGAAKGGRPPSHILDRNAELGRNPEYFLPGQQHSGVDEVEAASGLSQLLAGSVDAQSQRSLNRDDSKRVERKEQRAAARVDLRQRFAQYNRFIKAGDSKGYQRTKDNQMLRSQQMTAARQETKAAKRNIPKTVSLEVKLLTLVDIDAAHLRQKLKIEADYQAQKRAIQALSAPALPWRTWLHEQSKLGDQAALSALRGIVYQAQRDAKKQGDTEATEKVAANAAECSEQQYRKVMAQLLKEEQEEIAIRSANIHKMRPYQIDAILIRHKGLQWSVTGNGNVEYSDLEGTHLFTDRGSRVTFDRELVTDDDIRMALVHAQHKFGQPLTLTGDEPVFVRRMACLADDLGMAVLNPEMHSVIAQHRQDRELEIRQAVPEPEIEIIPTPQPAVQVPVSPQKPPEQKNQMPEAKAPQAADVPEPQTITPPSPVTKPVELALPPAADPVAIETPQERLRALVLAIDPQATFQIVQTQAGNNLYIGPIELSHDDPDQGFAQRTARGQYALHTFPTPKHQGQMDVEIKYRNTQPEVYIKSDKGVQR